jgi:hypothetical protein
VVQPQRVYLNASVGYGKHDVPIMAVRGAAAAVRTDRPLVERVVAPATLSLPVTRGQRVGEVRVYSGKRLGARRALVAQRSVARPGFGGRVGYFVSRTFHHIGSWF